MSGLELFFATASLLAMTVVASFIYYKLIKKAQNEYDGSKDLIKSITYGFTQQVTRITKVIKGIEQSASDAQRVAEEALKTSLESTKLARESREETKKLENQIEETDKVVSSIKEEIQKLATKPVAAPAQSKIEAPIPLKQDAVLENLTETELEVLTIIEEMGEGSVPEIRKRINKTREHTARLLKKLYEKGFIDRTTGGMPYKYYIRKEIKELIQQQKARMRIVV